LGVFDLPRKDFNLKNNANIYSRGTIHVFL
jgi:hypothetical protein